MAHGLRGQHGAQSRRSGAQHQPARPTGGPLQLQLPQQLLKADGTRPVGVAAPSEGEDAELRFKMACQLPGPNGTLTLRLMPSPGGDGTPLLRGELEQPDHRRGAGTRFTFTGYPQTSGYSTTGEPRWSGAHAAHASLSPEPSARPGACSAWP